MVPRKSRYMKIKKSQQKRLVKLFILSVTSSSILLGGSKMISPTYGQYVDTKQQGVEIQACFIFPQTVRDLKDEAIQLNQEIEQGIKDALAKVAGVNVSVLSLKISGFATNNEGDDISPPSYSGDSSSIEGLQALQSHLDSSISAYESNLSANQQKIGEYQGLSSEMAAVVNQLGALASEIFPNAKAQAELKNGRILEILEFIEESEERALKECKYEPDFFSNISTELTDFSTANKEKLVLLNDEITKTNGQIEQLQDNIKSLLDNISSLENSNQSMLGAIDSLRNRISEIEQQIQEKILQEEAEKAKKEKENLEKEAKEKEVKEEKEKLEKEAKEKADKEAKEKADKDKEGNKEEPKKDEPKQEEPKKEEPKQEEPKKEEPKQGKIRG